MSPELPKRTANTRWGGRALAFSIIWRPLILRPYEGAGPRGYAWAAVLNSGSEGGSYAPRCNKMVVRGCMFAVPLGMLSIVCPCQVHRHILDARTMTLDKHNIATARGG